MEKKTFEQLASPARAAGIDDGFLCDKNYLKSIRVHLYRKNVKTR
jgi:hypothetical protein